MHRLSPAVYLFTLTGTLALGVMGCSDAEPVPVLPPYVGDTRNPTDGTVGPDKVITTELTRDTMTPLGFTVSDAMKTLAGPHQAVFAYGDGTTTELSIQVTETGKVEGRYSSPYLYQDWETYTENDGISLWVSIDFTTSDGYFNERVPAVNFHITKNIEVWAGFDIYLTSSSDAYTIQGDYRYPTPSGETGDVGRLEFEMTLKNGGTTGGVVLDEAAPHYKGSALAGTW